jgi:hypothetical protein
VQQVSAGALDRVPPGVEHVAAMRQRERTAGVLLDHYDPDPEPVDLEQLVEDQLHRLGREPRGRFVEQQQLRLRD